MKGAKYISPNLNWCGKCISYFFLSFITLSLIVLSGNIFSSQFFSSLQSYYTHLSFVLLSCDSRLTLIRLDCIKNWSSSAMQQSRLEISSYSLNCIPKKINTIHYYQLPFGNRSTWDKDLTTCDNKDVKWSCSMKKATEPVQIIFVQSSCIRVDLLSSVSKPTEKKERYNWKNKKGREAGYMDNCLHILVSC